jgi:hypothetical protein
MQSSISKYFKSNLSPPVKDPANIVLNFKADPGRQQAFNAAIVATMEFDKVDDTQTNIGSMKLTPLESQVLSIRNNHPNCLLMVECGYRMRFFGDDAVTAARVLGIFCGRDHSFMVASVPTYRALVHCRRLMAAGHKVYFLWSWCTFFENLLQKKVLVLCS